MATETYQIVIQTVGAKATKRSLSDLEKQARRTAGVMETFRRALVLFSTVRAASNLINFADAAARIDNRLRVVTKSAKEFADAQAFVSKISKETFTSLESNAQGYSRIVQATDAAGISTDKAKDVFEAFAQAARVGGNTTEEYTASLIQFTQGLASGAVQGQELRSVVEQMPIVAQAIGKEFGVAGGKLIAFAKANEGILVSERVVKALSDALPELRRRANEIAPTIAGAFENIRTSAIEMVRDVQNSTNVIGFVTQGILALARNLETVTQAVFAFGLAWAGLKLAAPLGLLIQATQNFIVLTRVLGTATAAQLLFNRAAMLNPYTALAAGILAAGAALFYLYQRFEIVRQVVSALLLPLTTLYNIVGTVLLAGFNAFAEVMDRLYLVWTLFVTAMMPVTDALSAIGQAIYPIIEPFWTWLEQLDAANPLIAIFTDLLVVLVTTALTPLVLGLQGVVEVMYLMGYATLEVRDGMREATAQFFEFGEATKDAADEIERSAKEMEKAEKSTKGLNKGLEEASKNFYETEGYSKRAARAMEEAEKSAKGLGEQTKKTATDMDTLEKKSSGVSSSVKKVGDESTTAGTKVDGLGKEAKKAATEMDKLEKSMKEVADIMEKLPGELNKIATAIENLANKILSVGTASTRAGSAAANAASGMADASRNAQGLQVECNCCCDENKGPVPEPGAPGGPPAGSMGGTGGSSSSSNSSGNTANPNFQTSKSTLGLGLGLAGKKYTMGGYSTRITDVANEVFAKTFDSLKAMQDAQAEQKKIATEFDILATSSLTLKGILQESVDSGTRSMSEAAQIFDDVGMMLADGLQRADITQAMQNYGQDVGESLLRILNGSIKAGYNPGDLLDVSGAAGRKYWKDFTNELRVGVAGGGIRRGTADRSLAGFDFFEFDDKGFENLFTAGNNPFTVAETNVNRLTNSTLGLSNSFSSFRSNLDGTSDNLEKLYNKLDLARRNVSPLYGNIDPNQTLLGTGTIPGFRTGGSMMVPGSGAPDSRLMMARVSPGERVDVLTRRQQRQEGSGGSAMNFTINLNSAGAVKEYQANQAQVDRAIAGSMRRAQRNARVN